MANHGGGIEDFIEVFLGFLVALGVLILVGKRRKKKTPVGSLLVPFFLWDLGFWAWSRAQMGRVLHSLPFK